MTTVTQQAFADDRTVTAAGFNVTDEPGYQTNTVLSNPIDLINQFHQIDPFRAYIAANVITNALGYSVLNAMLWRHRKNHKAAETQAMVNECFGIDKFNDDEAEKTLLPDNWLGLENGLTELPRMEATKFLGVYKQLLREQLSEQHAKEMPPTMPQEVIAQLHGKKPKGADAQCEFIIRALEASGLPLKAMQEQQEIAQQRQADQNARQHASERDKLIGEFKIAIPEAFTDGYWYNIPLYVQYRYIFNIYKQAMKSIAKASIDVTEERQDAIDHFDGALEFTKEIYAELKAAAQHPQVILAFEQGALDAIKYGLE